MSVPFVTSDFKQSVNLDDIASKKIVDIFLQSIRDKADKTEVFIEVTTSEKKQLIKFSHFNNPNFPSKLYGSDLNRYDVAIAVSNIRSIEIVPRIGHLVKQKDKEKLAEIGITFNEQGFIDIPGEKFTCEKSVEGNNYHVDIYSKDGRKSASINAKKAPESEYCHVSLS